ncbi:MAG: chemotaxis protein CheW [SAR324 cluster bacterium]|nr:chemotaxis protein CheW [SAR324 cluster bacterium]
MEPPINEQLHKYITFRVDKELFGVHIDVVQQIISPPTIAHIPRTPEYFLGILNLRGEMISAIDLRMLFQLPKIPPDSDQRIAIMDFHNSRLGVLVDIIEGVINVDLGQVRPLPPLLDPTITDYLIGSFQVNEETTMLLLDQELLIDPNDFQCQEIPHQDRTNDSGELMPIENELVLLGFEILGEQFVLEVKDVDEIIQLPSITQVPRASHIIEGVFNLRHEIIPIIRLTRRLGMRDTEIKEDANVLVVSLAGVKLGVIVGTIQEVLRIRESEIKQLPNNVTGELAEHLGGIIQKESNGQHTIQSVLLLDKLFSLDELNRISDFQAKEMQTLQVEESGEEILLLLRFKIAGDLYALRVLQVNQIINMLSSLPIPQAPSYVQGIINVRGEIITVLDIPRLLKSPNPLDIKRAKIIIVETNTRKVGFLVEEIVGIAHLSNQIFDFPENWGQHDDEHSLVEAIGKEENGQVTVLLDVFATFHHATQYVEEHFSSSQPNYE